MLILAIWQVIKPIPLILKSRFLDLHLPISNDIVTIKIYDKLDGVKLKILDVDIPCALYPISQLIRFARASGLVANFNTRHKLFTQKLLKQGYLYH